MIFLKVSIEGTFTSLPDSSLNILQENPGISPDRMYLLSQRLHKEHAITKHFLFKIEKKDNCFKQRSHIFIIITINEKRYIHTAEHLDIMWDVLRVLCNPCISQW
jgi:hypothetical protein